MTKGPAIVEGFQRGYCASLWLKGLQDCQMSKFEDQKMLLDSLLTRIY